MVKLKLCPSQELCTVYEQRLTTLVNHIPTLYVTVLPGRGGENFAIFITKFILITQDEGSG